MARIEIQQKIKIYEKDGEEVELPTEDTIGVNAHWCDDSMIILVIDGQSYTVVGSDILIATENAMNSGD